jgi:hypothetical protein
MYDKRITNIIAPRLQIRSLNTDKRKATLLKITMENQLLLKRLQEK